MLHLYLPKWLLHSKIYQWIALNISCACIININAIPSQIFTLQKTSFHIRITLWIEMHINWLFWKGEKQLSASMIFKFKHQLWVGGSLFLLHDLHSESSSEWGVWSSFQNCHSETSTDFLKFQCSFRSLTHPIYIEETILNNKMFQKEKVNNFKRMCHWL